MDDFKHYNHLGFHNPYYIHDKNGFIVESSFDDIIQRIPVDERRLDFTALVQVFSTGYCFGDRTLVKGLNKSPWMAKPNTSCTDWEYFKVPDHKEIIASEDEIALRFYDLLEEELIEYVKPHNNIGLLLTGGMDSRIVAVLLKNAIESGKIADKNIYAYTWGHEESRDVIYASKIAKMYGWTWKHLIVDEHQLIENCELSIKNGCEFSPIHLHAMPQVAREGHLDCVLAGSFGDSVGRAEFSGKKVRELVGLENKIKNIGGILRNDFKTIVMKDVLADINHYHVLFPQNKMYQQYEQDQQLHYMRRMLNACMSVINKAIPLYQVFSSHKVFGYMWSLSPEVRTDLIYKRILEKHARELLSIPWARTGLPYPENEGRPDSFKKKHHDYGCMIRKLFLDLIEEELVSNLDVVKKLLDIGVVQKQLRNLQIMPMRGQLLLEEKLLYVTQVVKFIRKYRITVELEKYKGSCLNSHKEALRYKAKFFYKKFR